MLTTKHLQLRPIEREDATKLYHIWQDPAVARYLNIGTLKSIEETEDLIVFLIESAHVERYTILYKGEIIGTAGFNTWNMQDLSTEIGYDLSSNYWRRGFGTEVVRWLVQKAINEGMTSIRAAIDERNIASLKLIQKLGFMFYETFEEEGIRYSEYRYEI